MSSTNNQEYIASLYSEFTTWVKSCLKSTKNRKLLNEFYQSHCLYLPPMAGWFFFSALLSTYNKYVFGQGHYSFPCPLLLTSMHVLGQWIISSALCSLHPTYFGKEQVTKMSWRDYILVSVPCGCVATGDIGLSNLSLVTISVSFYTMIKSATPIFVLLWAYFFGLGKITYNLLFVVLIIACGEFLTVSGESNDTFDIKGFLLCLSSAVLSGARWTLVQCKIQSMDPPLKTSITTMRLLSPSMFFSMITLSLIVEKPWITMQPYMHSIDAAMKVFVLSITGAGFAISMILCELYLIMYTSAFILMIGGVLKEMLTIFVGVMVFHDQLNRVNITGCCLVFLGVIYYKVTYRGLEHEQPTRPKSAANNTTNGKTSSNAVITKLLHKNADNVDVLDLDDFINNIENNNTDLSENTEHTTESFSNSNSNGDHKRTVEHRSHRPSVVEMV